MTLAHALHALLDPPPLVFAAACLAAILLVRQLLPRSDFRTLVVSLAISLVLAEGTCRLLGLGNPVVVDWREQEARGRGHLPYYQPGSTLVYHYPSNPRGYFDAHNDVRGAINAEGFRGPEPRTPRTGPRIAFLGDSFTLGVGVRDEDTLPADVQRELAREDPGVECLNFGVSGHNTPEERRFLERFVLGFQPDVVIVVAFLNDADRVGTINFLSRPRILPRVRAHTWFGNALAGTAERAVLTRRMIRHYRQGFDENNPGYSRMRTALEEAKRVAESHGARFVVALYPVLYRLDASYPFLEIHEKIGAFCRAHDIGFVDLLPAFLGRRDVDLWVHASDQHPNEMAQRLAARAVAGYLVREGLVGGSSASSSP